MLKTDFKEFCKWVTKQPKVNCILLDFANDVAADDNFPKFKDTIPLDMETYKENLVEYLNNKACDAAKDAFLHLWTIYAFAEWSLKFEPNPVIPVK